MFPPRSSCFHRYEYDLDILVYQLSNYLLIKWSVFSIHGVQKLIFVEKPLLNFNKSKNVSGIKWKYSNLVHSSVSPIYTWQCLYLFALHKKMGDNYYYVAVTCAFNTYNWF